MQMSELSEKYKQGSLLGWQRAINFRCQFSFSLNMVWLPENPGDTNLPLLGKLGSLVMQGLKRC